MHKNMSIDQISLNEKSKASIERSVGLSFEQIVAMPATEIDSHIEKKIGKKLEFFPVMNFLSMRKVDKLLARI
jgi:hypothetical protein